METETNLKFCEALFKIIEMLELINDMEAYYVVNECLKNDSVDKNQVTNELSVMAQTRPKMLKIRRLDQLWTYLDYAYMRKKWERYCKSKNIDIENWNQVLNRVLSFADPIWSELCKTVVEEDIKC